MVRKSLCRMDVPAVGCRNQAERSLRAEEPRHCKELSRSGCASFPTHATLTSPAHEKPAGRRTIADGCDACQEPT
jgi:hypothetical protein